MVSESALICGYTAQFSNLNLEGEKVGLTIRDLLIKALREENPNPNEPYYHVSQIIDV